MRPTTRNLLCAGVLVGATTLITSTVVSQQYEDAMQQHEDMMEAWMKINQPGKEHERFAEAVGRWNSTMTMWMYPGAEPQKGTSTSEFKTILGGRYLVEKMKAKSSMGGELMEWEAMGIFGFDNQKQKHFFIWLDSMSTGAMIAEGQANAAGDEVTYFADYIDPMTNQKKDIKSVLRHLGEDKSQFVMYEKLPDGSWHKHLVADSTRDTTAGAR